MLDTIIGIVREAGQIMLQARDIEKAMHSKTGIGNFVTDFDVAVQKHLERSLLLALPGAHFIGEEGDAQQAENFAGDCFIVDPIDGTANFTRNLHHSAISVAWLKDGQVEAGVVYDPYLDELFYAQRGKGACCNGKSMLPVQRDLEHAIFLFGASAYMRREVDDTFRITRALFDKALDLRCSGSAALDLCYVAAGRVEAFFELSLFPWDYAAGVCIIQEAGGKITNIQGDALPYHAQSSVFAASSPALHAECMEAIKAIKA